ncbi:MAG TPA: response regulator transcription factor [Burkholderiales bacterium]|nr:response regulator transcription factor [Burkholderiales bacterium]
MIRVLVADDHKLVREGLKGILAAAEDLLVAGEAASGDEALALARANDYDLALLDMSMPGVSGIELIRRLRLEKPALRILVLSMHGEQQYAARALKAGAAGYLTKDSASEQLVGAIRKVAAGGLYITAAAAESLVSETAAGGAAAPHASLSDREFEIFRLLAGGHGPTEIAERLHVSVKTVSTHKARILQKMNLDSTAALVRYALEHDLLDGKPGA